MEHEAVRHIVGQQPGSHETGRNEIYISGSHETGSNETYRGWDNHQDHMEQKQSIARENHQEHVELEEMRQIMGQSPRECGKGINKKK